MGAGTLIVKFWVFLGRSECGLYLGHLDGQELVSTYERQKSPDLVGTFGTAKYVNSTCHKPDENVQ